MLAFTKLLIFLLTWGTVTSIAADYDTLKSVQILFRHGDRARDDGYQQPTGQMKQSGKKQMYDLGIFFRQRYDGLIKTSYDENEISILSSDVARTIQSASLVSYGLYKDFNFAADWNKDEKTPYEPITVRTIPKKYDRCIQIFPDCPRLTELDDESGQTYFDRYAKENRDIVEYYYNNSGEKTTLDVSKEGLQQIFIPMMLFQDEIVMNVTENIPVVKWAERLSKNLSFLSFKAGFLRESVNTVEKKRLNAGSLVQMFISNMEEPPASRAKMNLFSGHDRIFMFLLGSLGIDNLDVPNVVRTGTSLMVELHENPELESKPYVQLLLRNETNHEPYILEIPNCGNPCYLTKFKELTTEIIPTDFDAECATGVDSNLKLEYFTSTTSTKNKLNITAVSILAVFVVLVIVLIQVVVLSKRKNYAGLV